ncbi:YdeI/OmpD-associated family protein [Pseudoalteromonas sp. T1lg23B]|uniref:YdeI/OmpD-associated family protein n=1 Tax=Pseudoalteromonas sp. T1lg23B TaxID=2077097 RepID=UPI001F1C1442|nr:YdeI/OmpD-associated family protein [Pseudoalteromonas sp. T1lg23B]
MSSHFNSYLSQTDKKANTHFAELARFEIRGIDKEPEPDVPYDLLKALEQDPPALETWQATTTIARVDWIHRITTAKQAKTRLKRVNDACSMLSEGKKRVCCFDTSGFYSKAFGAPEIR